MKKRNIYLSIIFMIGFVILLVLVVSGATEDFDQAVYHAVISLRSNFLDQYFIHITRLGNTMMIIFVVLLFFVSFRNRYALILIASAIDSFLLNTLIKVCVQRERPNVLRLISQGGYSFPSGHTMMAVCVYGYLLYLAFSCIKNKVLKYGVSVFLFLVILSIGISRIYVGVHFATDVLAGYLFALSYLFLLIEVTKKVKV